VTGNRVITLLTDFGTQDHYVASLKGVILGINPRCTIVDISHHVGSHDIQGAAFLLGNAFGSFPKGTIHVSVVDPGVGGPRRPILIVTPRYYFVGPDNGLFTFALLQDQVRLAVALTRRKYFLPRIRSTFHGRDVFAPVAAHLSKGVRPQAFGQKIDTWETLHVPRPKRKGRALQGEIVHIDVFGNLTSNISEASLSEFSGAQPFSIRVGKKTIDGLKKAYCEAKKGGVMALIGSGGFLEVSVREGSARKELDVKRGDKIEVLIL
jgi:S-adenosylmethionine hydrolase